MAEQQAAAAAITSSSGNVFFHNCTIFEKIECLSERTVSIFYRNTLRVILLYLDCSK